MSPKHRDLHDEIEVKDDKVAQVTQYGAGCEKCLGLINVLL
jgi:hypothetical protein